MKLHLRSLPANDAYPIISINDVSRACASAYPGDTAGDALLFRLILRLGFFNLHRLAELTDPDKPVPEEVQARKRITLASVSSSSQRSPANTPLWYSYFLAYHKVDTRGKRSSHVFLNAEPDLTSDDPTLCFHEYLAYRRTFAHSNPWLLVRSTGQVPTRSWFLARLRHQLSRPELGSKCLRAGGATRLAQRGWTERSLKYKGRWSSIAFKLYIQDFPSLQRLLAPPPIESPPNFSSGSSPPHSRVLPIGPDRESRVDGPTGNPLAKKRGRPQKGKQEGRTLAPTSPSKGKKAWTPPTDASNAQGGGRGSGAKAPTKRVRVDKSI